MSRTVHRVVGDLRRGENLDIYVVVPLSLTVAILGISGSVSSEIVQAAALATLSIFAVSILTNRHQVAELGSGTRLLADVVQQSLQGRVSVDQVLTTRLVGLDEALRNARDIRLSGVTLTRFLGEHRSAVRVLLSSGAKVRAIVLDPDAGGVEQAGLRCVETSVNYYQPRLASAIGMFKELAEKETSGSIELRGVPYLPAFGLTMTEPETSGGRIYVEQYHHRTAEPHPTFCLLYDRDRNGQFYNFFLGQFEILWESARPIDLLPEPAPIT